MILSLQLVFTFGIFYAFLEISYGRLFWY